jgi:hypothetical protein
MSDDWSSGAQEDADASASQKKAGSSQEPCPLDWIKIELLDAEDKPIANEPYILFLKDGTEQPGNLDSNGFAWIQELPRGEYKVRFPKREEIDSAEMRTWFSFELLDAGGRPVADEPFCLTLPTGDVIEGKLNQDGQIRVNDVFPGLCRISFPERDAQGRPLPSEPS